MATTLLPFEYEDVEVVSGHEIVYKNVTFTRAFGSFELGSEWDEVSINLQTGEVYSYDMHGNEDTKQDFRLEPGAGGE